MITPKDLRKNNGGTRSGSGRKPRTEERIKQRNVDLTNPEYLYLVNRHGTFANAVRSLLIQGWEFETDFTDEEFI